MTEQIPHWVYYNDNRYQLMSWLPQIGTMLKKLGINPKQYSTACRHGYVAEYHIDGDELFLTKLEVEDLYALNEEVADMLPLILSEYPPIGDVGPVAEYGGAAYATRVIDMKREVLLSYSIVYRLKHLCQISGSMTLVYGRYRVRKPHFEGPFHPQTLKITLERGHVKEIKDITKEVEQIRRDIDATYEDAHGLRDQSREEERDVLYRQYHALVGETI